MENLDREAIEAFVEEARRATGEAIEKYDAWPFGDTPELADELAELVIHGPKRATAGLLAASEADGDAVPVEGGYSVVTDGAGKPVCVIRTSKVVVQRLGDIDAAFAWDEGEGDRSLAYWRAAHHDFFGRSGITYDEDSPVVCERFALVYPIPD
jgi:uncharacterized protein YhfF